MDRAVQFGFTCEICGQELDERSCAAVCPNCGFTLDCSDLNALPPDRMAEGAAKAAEESGAAPEAASRTLADWQSK